MTSVIVLVCFVSSLAAPIVKAASTVAVPVKIAGHRGLVDLNTASVQDLQRLPGIGFKVASSIVQYRTANGPFSSLDSVAGVPGVGSARLKALKSSMAACVRSPSSLRTVGVSRLRTVKTRRGTNPSAPSGTNANRTVSKTLTIIGPSGDRVNVNDSNSRNFLTSLVRAGFTDAQANALTIARLQNGRFVPFASFGDLHLRLNARRLAEPFLDGGGKSLPPAFTSTSTPSAKTPEAAGESSGPAAPSSITPQNPATVVSRGRDLLVRAPQKTRSVEVELNGPSTASSLYRKLRGVGLSESQAKDIAKARIKGRFQGYSDLKARAKSVEGCLEPGQQTSKGPAAAETTASTASTATIGSVDAKVSQIQGRCKKILARQPTSEAGYDRAIKGLTLARKQLAEAHDAKSRLSGKSDATHQTQLTEIDRNIVRMGEQKASFRAQQTLRLAKARLNTEAADYVRQANELLPSAQAQTATDSSRLLRGLKNAYDGLYKTLEAQFRLEGKPAEPSTLLQDPRLSKIALRIDELRKVPTTQAQPRTESGGTKDSPSEPKTETPSRPETSKPESDSPFRSATPVDRFAPTGPAEPQTGKPAETGPFDEGSRSSTIQPTTLREDILRTKIEALKSQILREGGYKTTDEVLRASRASEATGDLKRLSGAIDELRTIRTPKRSGVPAQPSNTEGVETGGSGEAARPSGTEAASSSVSAPGATSPQTKKSGSSVSGTRPAANESIAAETQVVARQSESVLQGTIDGLTKTILEQGRFSSAQEVYEASQRPNVRGDLAKLNQQIEELRSLRTARSSGSSQVSGQGSGHGSEPETPAAATPPKSTETESHQTVRQAQSIDATQQQVVEQKTPVESAPGESAPTQDRVAVSSSGTAKGPQSGSSTAEARSGGSQKVSAQSQTVAGAAAVPSESSVRSWPQEYTDTLTGKASIDSGKPNWVSRLNSFLKEKSSIDPESAAADPDYWGKFKETVDGSLSSTSRGGGERSSVDSILARENELKLQAQEIRGKLVKQGAFSNVEEVNKASEAVGTMGDLARLSEIDREIQTLRIHRQTITDGDGPVSSAGGAEGLAETLATEGGGLDGSSVTNPVGAVETGLTGGRTQDVASVAVPDSSVVVDPESGGVASGTSASAGSTNPAAEGGFFEKVANWLGGNGFQTKAEIEAAKTAASEGVPPEVVAMREIEQGGLPTDSKLSELEGANLKLKELRAKAHDLTLGIKKEGTLDSIEEVQTKSGEGSPKGKLADLKQVNDQIAELNGQKEALAEQIEANPKAARGEQTSGKSSSSGGSTQGEGRAGSTPAETESGSSRAGGSTAEPSSSTGKTGALDSSSTESASTVAKAAADGGQPAAPDSSSGSRSGVSKTVSLESGSTGAVARTESGIAGGSSSRVKAAPAEAAPAAGQTQSTGQGGSTEVAGTAGHLRGHGTASVETAPAKASSGGTVPAAAESTVARAAAGEVASVEGTVNTAKAPAVGGAAVETVPANAPAAGGQVHAAAQGTTAAPAQGRSVAPIESGQASVTAPAGGSVSVESALGTARSASSGQTAFSGNSSGTATVQGPPTTRLAELRLQNAQIQSQLTELQGESGGASGLFRRWVLMDNSSKTAEELKAKLEQNNSEITNLESNSEAQAKADAAFAGSSKNQNASSEISKLIQAHEAEMAKLDSNSSSYKAHAERVEELRSTPLESFASQVTNSFVVGAATNILLSLGRQAANGEELDFTQAIGSVANSGFIVGTLGSAAGSYLGSQLLLMPVVDVMLTNISGALPPFAGVFLRLLPSFVGGAVGGGLAGSLMGQEIDWTQVLVQTIGSALGTSLAMSFFPSLGMFGQIAAGMIGGWLAEKVLGMFRGDSTGDSTDADGSQGGGPTELPSTDGDTGDGTSFSEADVQSAQDNMTAAYQKYVQAEQGSQLDVAAASFQEYLSYKHKLDTYRQVSFGGSSTSK